jgi:hypothetical protein
MHIQIDYYSTTVRQQYEKHWNKASCIKSTLISKISLSKWVPKWILLLVCFEFVKSFIL